MSSIPTKQIDGDAAIGRNVTIGGKATIRGSATIGHNLKVEGWLDARNIKGPNKGIFLDVTKLREAYPLPHDGWWALVGNTLPAPLYIADGGAWVATGTSAGNPTTDSQQYNEAVAALDANLKILAAGVSANKQGIDQICTQVNTIGILANTLSSDVSDIKTRMNDAETSIQNINNSKGMPNGLAPLDGSGRVDAHYLPSYVDDVVEFDGFDRNYNFLGVYHEVPEPYNNTEIYNLQYDTSNVNTGIRFAVGKGFSAGVKATVYEGHNLVGLLYIDADNHDLSSFGDLSEDGFANPVSGKIYVDVSDAKQYRWSGSQLIELSQPTAIGNGYNEAFRGSDGNALREKVSMLESDYNNKLGDSMAYITPGWKFIVSADDSPMTLEAALDYVAENVQLLDNWRLPFFGWEISFITETGWVSYRYVGEDVFGAELSTKEAAILDLTSWELIVSASQGGSGSCELCTQNAKAITQLSGKVTDLESSVSSAAANATSAKSAADNAAAAVTELSNKVTGLESSVTSAASMANAAKTAADNAAEATTQLSNEVTNLGSSVTSASNIAAAAKTAADNAAAAVEELENQISNNSPVSDKLEFVDFQTASGFEESAHPSGLSSRYPTANAPLNLIAKPSSQDLLLLLPIEEEFVGKTIRLLDPRRITTSETATVKSVHITTYSTDYKIYGTEKASNDFWISLKGGYVELLAVKTYHSSGVAPRVEWIAKQLIKF